MTNFPHTLSPLSNLKNSSSTAAKLASASIGAALLFGTLLVLSPLAQAQNTTNDTAPSAESAKAKPMLNHHDRHFLKELAQVNRAEIAAAEIAQTKASDEQLKSFAQQMIADHNQALSEITSLAAAKNVELPSMPNAKQERELARLQSLSAVEFNKEYLNKAGIDDHRAALKLVHKVSKDAHDEDLKALAQKMQPTIAAHLKMALDMNKS